MDNNNREGDELAKMIEILSGLREHYSVDEKFLMILAKLREEKILNAKRILIDINTRKIAEHKLNFFENHQLN